MIRSLTLQEFQLHQEKGALVLDIRHQTAFVNGFIPNSIFVGIDGLFEPWVALFIEKSTNILLVSPKGREEEAFEKLSAVGFKNILGYLEGSFNTWEKAGLAVETITSITANDLKVLKENSPIAIYDIRKQNEYDAGHLPNVHFKPLADLNTTIKDFDLKEETAYIHCGGGYRSVIACSILKRNDIHNVVDIAGGFGAIKKTDLVIEHQ